MSDASPLEHPIPVPSTPAPTAPASRRFMLLFIFLLATLLLYPFADSSTLGIYMLRVMGSGVILFSIYAVGYRRSLLVFAILLGAPAMAQHIWILKAANPSVLAMTNIVLSFCFDVFVVCVVLKRIFARDHSNSETIFGALCIYLLVGFSFASLFHLLSVVRPGAFYFDPHANFRTVPQRFDFVYYSFGTITSLGAPGITPVSAHARSLTIVEAILGVLFLAVLVSRLMDAYRPGPSLWQRNSRHH
jgi:multisubunit Na+/H+ antiporter MnhC subunit